MSIIDDIGIADDLASGPRYRPIAWDKFVVELLEAYRPPLRSLATHRQMEHALDQVTALTVESPDGGRRPMVATTADLRPAVIAELIRTRRPGLSPYTVRALLRAVSAACGVAVDHGYLRVSPFYRLKIGRLVPAGKPQGRRHLSRQEIRALLDTLAAGVEGATGWRAFKTHRLRALVATIAYTGLRRGEALFLRVEDMDLPGRLIHVRPHAGRGLKTDRSAAMVPMPEALVPILEAWLPWRLAGPERLNISPDCPWMFPNCRRRGPWHDGTKGDKPLCMLKAAGKRAGIGDDINFQQLRRSLATHLRTHFGASRDLASRILRHSAAVDDQFYLEDDPDNLRGAVRDVDF